MLVLAGKGLLTAKHLKSKKNFTKMYMEEAVKHVKHTKVMTGIERDFIIHSQNFWQSKGDKLVSLVLFATAVEQSVNVFYRYILRARNLDDAQITAAIKSVSLEAKLGWFLRLSTGCALSPRLTKKVKLISEIRNAIVHYKAVDTLLDDNTGSHDVILNQIKALGRLGLKGLFEDIQIELNQITCSANREYGLAIRAIQKMEDWGWWDEKFYSDFSLPIKSGLSPKEAGKKLSPHKKG